MNCHRPKLLVAAIISASGLLVALVFLLRPGTVFPSVPWQIQGQVVEGSSNALAGVTIAIEGTLSATHGLFGSRVESFRRSTNTDGDGRFTLTFSAAAFKVVFSKVGYTDKEYTFESIGTHLDDTNQALRVIMSPD